MLKRIDSWLIANLYQRLVDRSNRTPAWWVEQCACALFAFSILRLAFRPVMDSTAYIATGSGILVACLFFVLSRAPDILASAFKAEYPRWFILCITVVGAISALVGIATSIALGINFNDRLVSVGSHFVFLSIYYFAACKNPPPPKPKTRWVPSTNLS